MNARIGIAAAMALIAHCLTVTSTNSLSVKSPLPLLDTDIHTLVSTHYFSEYANWIIPGLLLQGRHPSLGRGSARERVKDIVQKGRCSTFVCLQAGCPPQIVSDGGRNGVLLGGSDEWFTSPMNLDVYKPYVEEIVADSGEGVEPFFVHYGIRDMSAADDLEDLYSMVQNLASRVRDGETLYLHCLSGNGRAGLVGACLLGALYEKVDAEEALNRIGLYCGLRNSNVGAAIKSPETQVQRDQVRKFYEMKQKRSSCPSSR